jgi:hypothetical protein
MENANTKYTQDGAGVSKSGEYCNISTNDAITYQNPVKVIRLGLNLVATYAIHIGNIVTAQFQ